MFTVIFAEKETIKLFEETKMFFGPLYNSEHVAFCEWDKYAECIETMVPDLYDIIEYHNEWRAIILYDDGFEKLNPFDFTDYSESFFSKETRNWDYFKNRRKARLEAYAKAVSNPLVKLTTALSEVPNFKSAVSDEDCSMLLSDEMQTYEFMLKRLLKVLTLSEIAVRFDKYQRDDLKRFVQEDQIDQLVTFIKNSDVSGIVKVIPDTEMLDFIKFLYDDPIYTDPEYAECLIENTQKHKLLNSIVDNFSMNDKLPIEVICCSPRTFDFEKVEQEIKWKKKDEASASRFANYNLYNEKLRFIFSDVLPKDHRQYKFDQIKFMCLLLIISNYGLPNGAVTPSNVYRAGIDFDSGIVGKICGNYISKLKATQNLLREIEYQLIDDSEQTVDNKTAQRLFESDISIPVKITSETSESDLYAVYNGIGLSTDCPGDEYSYWTEQYRDINKRFLRYLREPRRAVKTAVSEGLRKNNTIKDDRTLLLSESQVEDVKFHIMELEQKMVTTTTTHLFNTKKFNEQIQEADKEVKKGIAQRMTKQKTIYTALVALLAYFLGFIPLIISNLHTGKSFLFSLMVSGIVLAIFLLVGFIYLFSLKKKLINRFMHFNYVMGGILGQINSALAGFSAYISNVCNLMRDFSVLEKRDSVVTKTKRILFYHNMQLSEQIERVNDMFSKYVDFNKIPIKECPPYDFDFTILRDYEYEMPSIASRSHIEYMQPGNEITIPIDYVKSITLEREELYD